MRSIFIFCFLIFATAAFGQPDAPEMADAMRSNGKIYVVVAVLVTILAGLVLYVIRIDRKLGKLEKETNHLTTKKYV